MAETIYEAGDVEGYAFAFDAIGKYIDWSAVVDAAKDKQVKLRFDLSMLFTDVGESSQDARGIAIIPKGSNLQAVLTRSYQVVRNYIRAVTDRIAGGDDTADMVADSGKSLSNTVALLSAVVML